MNPRALFGDRTAAAEVALAELDKAVASLEARVRELERRLGAEGKDDESPDR